MATLRGMIGSRSGATGIEYGLIAGLIAVVIIGSLGVLGGSVDGLYEDWTAAVAAALGGSP